MAEFLVKIIDALSPLLRIRNELYFTVLIAGLLILIYAVYSIFRFMFGDRDFKPNWILLTTLPFLFCYCFLYKYDNFSSGRFTQCMSNIKNLGIALDMYASDNDGNYPATLKKLNPEYLRVIPTCAQAGKDTYTDGYLVYNDSEAPENSRYTLYCRGRYHIHMGAPENYPQYLSTEGLISK